MQLVEHLLPLRNSFWLTFLHFLQLGPVYLDIKRFSSVVNYTLLGLGGLQPLCGIGVVSFMEITCMPLAAIALIAVSLPGPGPVTNTMACLTPYSIALPQALEEVICAANGVPFLVPLKPLAPEVDQASTLPFSSVMVTMVLLKEQLMYTLAKVTTPWLRLLAWGLCSCFL
jgi:hypothetical protein